MKKKPNIITLKDVWKVYKMGEVYVNALQGLNFKIDDEEPSVELHEVDPGWVDKKIESLKQLRARRDKQAVDKALDNLRSAIEAGQNIMPPLVEAAKVYATVGEMAGVLKATYGLFAEPVF